MQSILRAISNNDKHHVTGKEITPRGSTASTRGRQHQQQLQDDKRLRWPFRKGPAIKDVDLLGGGFTLSM